MNDASDIPESAIAIIGMAGRFPGARDLAEFWNNLRAGVESLEQFSDEELLRQGIDPALLADTNYVKAGTSLERAADFDAAFFGINPREAEIMDPQQRLFLECAWEAVEDAGYDVDRLDVSVGVFAGARMNTYLNTNVLANPQALASSGAYQAMIGNDKDFLATRVSYKLNLRGPSLTLQTACSTSLVAIHLACQNLLTQQCDMALAGGVALTFPQRVGYLYQEGMIASPDGKVRPFDSEGRGIRSGDGVGVVLLKRLRDAIADHDAIRAVILGTAVNNDGAQKIGYTAPSVSGQAEVIATAQAVAEVDPSTISYVEANGTATPVGDPIEIAALTKAFRARTARRQFCAIGSVKSNIGHLDAAAGIAGLIKTVLALQHAEIPASLNFTAPNPQIDFEASPFFVNTTLRTWAVTGPRRAGVSSFGIGGTNAHAILQEWDQAPTHISPPAEQQIILSARSPAGLDHAVERLAGFLERRPDIDLADLAYTLQAGRKVFEHRALLAAADSVAAAASLRNARALARAHGEPGARPVNFMFSGQGSQYAAMGWDLYQSEAAFRAAVDHCADTLRTELGLDLRSVLYPEYARLQGIESAADLLDETRITQPALFAVEFALAKLWEQWGVRPQSMIGHGIGEYVAACLAGVFSVETALLLVAERGALMQHAQPGAMLAVQLEESQLVARLGPGLDIAALDAPGSCVVSGPIAAIEALQWRLEQDGVGCRRQSGSHAFYSATMDGVVPLFVARVAREVLHQPSIPFVSSLTGTWITAEQATDPGYWGQQLRGTVRFADGLRTLSRDPHSLLLEVGPGNTLRMLAQQVLSGKAEDILTSLPHPLDQTPAGSHLRRCVGRLWLAGAAVDWDGLHGGLRRRVPLPTYPFERRRFWVQPLRTTAERPASELQRKSLEHWFWLPSWLRTLPAPARPALPARAQQRWLIFANEDAATTQLLGEFRARGIALTIVWAGDAFSQLPGGTRIRADVREHYAALLEHYPGFDCILHLWNATAADAGPVRLELGRKLAYYSPLFLAQELAEIARREPLTLLAVSTDMQRVDNSELLRTERSLLVGPVRVMSEDVPALRARSVDLAAADWSAGNARRLADVLQFEAEHDSSASSVAWRGGYRWEQSSAPLPLPTPDERQIPLRERGIYLITGGTGRVGLAIARDLAATRRARLVLTSRNGAPRDEAWELARAELQRHGAEVCVLTADVSDPSQMVEVLAQTRACFGELHGIIHAAGVSGDDTPRANTAAESEPILRPKLEGTLALDHLLDGAQLDFLALFSSISTAPGWHATAADTSANAFLDAFAQAGIARCARRVVTINWGAWSDTIATDSETARLVITPKEGVQAFYRVLAREDVRQLYVTPIPLPELQAAAASRKAHAAAPALPPTEANHHERPALQNAFIAPRNSEEERLAAIWSDLLGIAPIGVEDNFFDLGGHSLLATRLLARLQDVFRVRLPMRAVFESSTIDGLLQSIRSFQVLDGRTAVTEAEEQREEIEL
jgi:acyl transferase domain-containing protein/NAD(P)-dependent dehydrogenase (short-subunit alcohol dehydrogenase family)